jgi:hypothetical protein
MLILGCIDLVKEQGRWALFLFMASMLGMCHVQTVLKMAQA